jgi:hypothetical protein
MKNAPLSKLELALLITIMILGCTTVTLFGVWWFLTPLSSAVDWDKLSVVENVGQDEEKKSQVEEYLR